MTEADLIQGCLANKRIAQRELYEKYKKAMFTLAYRLCGDFDEAADILQESFIDIFKGLDSFKNQSTLGAWMKTIVSRKAIARFRNKVFFDQLDSVAEQRQVVWESDLDIELLEKGIMALPEGYRSVIILYEIEGYKHHEIAKLLGITEGTSKSQLYHAKRKLKEWIENAK